MLRTIILIALLFSPSAFAAEKPVKLFLLGGQSNMDGCGKWNELPENLRETPANVRVWDNHKEEWKKIGEDTTAIARKLQFGPEVVFSHRLASAFPDHEIRLVKFSAGGTSLADSWLPEKKKMYPRFITNYRNALSNLEKSGHTVETSGMLWMQGEGDAEKIERANAYEKNLEILLADVRTQTGKANLPVVLGRISSSLLKETPWSFDHTAIVQKAQETVTTKDPYSWLIPADDLTMLKDNTHFDSAGQIALGERMAKQMLEALAPDKKGAAPSAPKAP
ncbi:MAG: sialate O-acetylesterase [Verrucomicrobiota bacterium]